MSARGNLTDETKTRRRTMAFMGNLIAILSLVVIGYPLAPATIRTMLVGWILVVAAIMRIILGHRFQPLGSAVTLRSVRIPECDRRPNDVVERPASSRELSHATDGGQRSAHQGARWRLGCCATPLAEGSSSKNFGGVKSNAVAAL